MIIKNITKLTIVFVLLASMSTFISPIKVHAATSQIRITELMYDPSGTGVKEFIEIYNGGDVTVNLGGHVMYGVTYTFPVGTTLGAGQYGVIARNSAALGSSYPSARIFGQYSGKLKGSGEEINISYQGTVLSRVNYTFGGIWPLSPKDGGPSLSLIRPNANETIAYCWAPSANNGGTPSYANSIDTSWSNSRSGGCSNSAYPTTAPAPSSSGSPKSTSNNQPPIPGSTTVTEQKKIEAQKQAEKVQAEQKKIEAQKQAEKRVAEEVRQQLVAQSINKKNTNRNKRILAVILVIILILVSAGMLIYKKTKLQKRFEEVIKKHKVHDKNK